jgi:serine/threonine protein kinase
MQELIGKSVGQYQIVEQIGQGGMATIFKAYQPAIDRFVAIKVLPKEFAQDPNFLKRFIHEARAIAALEHPHILPVHDFGTEGDINYMVMRYVRGGTLSNVMGKPIPLSQVAKYIGDVARALDYAHRSGVVHRDIKPSNILIDEHGEVLLTDFGIAKIVEGSQSTQLTAAGSILGTPAYMSPEQAKSSEIDGRSDIYSLGVVLYELLTGEPPYQAETPFAVVLKHMNDPLPPPRQKNPDIPEAFERIVLKAMAKSPSDRFQTAGDMAASLDNALSQTAAQASGVNRVAQAPDRARKVIAEPPSAPVRKKKTSSLLIIAVLIVILACITIGGFGMLAILGTISNNAAQTQTAVTITEPPSVDSKPGLDTEFITEPTKPPVERTEPEAREQLLVDDFIDNRNDWLIEDYEDEFGEVSTAIEDGFYFMRVTSTSDFGNTIWVEPITYPFDDFVLSANMTAFTDNEDFLYGVVFRSTDEGDAYTFEIDNGGFVIGMATADDWLELVEYTWSDSIQYGEFNELTVRAVGSQLEFFINGERIATVNDTAITSGYIGLIAEVFEEDGELDVVVDQVQVIAP